MTTRTFKQYGLAYGIGSVTVVATIDGIEVFNGVVPSVNSLIPTTLDEIQPLVPEVLFSWTEDVAFEGTRSMTITVNGGNLLLKNTHANYGVAFDGIPIVRYPGLTGGPELFTPFYAHAIDAPPDPCCQDTECENRPTLIHDPLSDVTINGVPKTREYLNNVDGKVLAGQFCWNIPDAGEFTATVNIFAGAE